MRLTRNINPQEASFILVRYFCRLENQYFGTGAPATAVLLEKAFRFWEVTSEFHLYPLYSVVVTHMRMRLFRSGENTETVLGLITTLSCLYYLYRLEFDPSESTDIIYMRNIQTVILSLTDYGDSQDGSTEFVTSVSGVAGMTNPFSSATGAQPIGVSSLQQAPVKKLIVKTKRAFWIELRRLIVIGYGLVLRNEAEVTESCIRDILDSVRKQAAEKPLAYDMADRCSAGMQRILKRFDELVLLMKSHYVPKAIFVQIFGQLCAILNGHWCNSLMLRRSYASMHAAAAFRADLRQLDAWLRANIPSDALQWVLSRLMVVSEMINVVFMNKNLLMRPEIRAEVCPHLTAGQLCQIVTSYDAQKGEEPVSVALIQSLMNESGEERKSHQADIGNVLIDVTLLAPLDLTVHKENWVSILSIKDFKETPLPASIYEEYIAYRDRPK